MEVESRSATLMIDYVPGDTVSRIEKIVVGQVEPGRDWMGSEGGIMNELAKMYWPQATGVASC